MSTASALNMCLLFMASTGKVAGLKVHNVISDELAAHNLISEMQDRTGGKQFALPEYD